MKRSNKRKGFTLVELLIVIVVIGILSAMMMMSSGEAISSARASNITSNLKNLQTATLAYWADNMGKLNKITLAETDKPTLEKVIPYLKEDDNSEIQSGGYTVTVTNEGWFVGYTFAGIRGDNNRVKTKIEGRSGALGLLKSNNGDDAKKAYSNTDATVYIRVR